MDAYWDRYLRWFVSMGVSPVAGGKHRKNRPQHFSGELHSALLESLRFLGWILVGAAAVLVSYAVAAFLKPY